MKKVYFICSMLICMVLLSACANNNSTINTAKTDDMDNFDISISGNSEADSSNISASVEEYEKAYRENSVLREQYRIYTEAEMLKDDIEVANTVSKIENKTLADEIGMEETFKYDESVMQRIESVEERLNSVKEPTEVPDIPSESMSAEVTKLVSENEVLKQKIARMK